MSAVRISNLPRSLDDIGIDVGLVAIAAIEAVTAIWCEVLDLPSIDPDDDLLELGGDSLHAAAIVVRLRDRLGMHLSIAQLFASPTVAGVVRQIAALPASAVAETPAVGPSPEVLPSQARLWFLDRLIPDPQAYNVYRLVELDRLPDPLALRDALAHLAASHDALRTSFDDIDGRPVTRLHDRIAVPFCIADLSEQPDGARERALALARTTAAAPFDLTRAPLWRANLWILDTRRCLLGITCHHIVTDGWSMGVWLRQLSALYALAESGRLPASPPPSRSFAAEVLAGSLSRDGAEYRRQLDWWKERLRGMSAPLTLPFSKPRPRMQSFRGDVFRFELADDLTALLDGAVGDLAATRYRLALTAFAVALHRTAATDDIAVGTPYAGRDSTASESMLGFFVRTLIVRANLVGEPTFRETLDRVREATLGAFSHSDIPLETLVEELGPVRDTSRQPLFQTMFLYQNYAGLPDSLGDIPLRNVPIHNATAMFDLRLVLEDRPDGGLSAWIEFNTDLFERTYVEDFAGHFLALLRAGLTDPDVPVSRLPMLAADERVRIVEEWNDTRATWPDDLCLHRLFEKQAGRQPGAIAVVAAGREYTFGELDEYANQIAHELLDRCPIPGSFVGVCLPRSFDTIAAVLGVLKAGCAYVPLDASYPVVRLAQMIDDTRMPLILTHRAALDRLPGGGYEAICLDRMAQTLARRPGGNPPSIARPSDRAYAIYTSGSTGQPKGVVVTHAAAVNTLDWVNRTRAIRPGDLALFATSLSFDLSVWDIFGVLGGGGTVRVASEAELRDPARLLKILRTEPITVWDSAPAALVQLVPFLDSASPSDRNENLRLVMLSGDWIPTTLPDAIRAAFPLAEVLSLGGATEAAIWSNSFAVGVVDPAWRSIPYGRPIQNCRYHILDAHRQPLPAGVPGELYIGGTCLAVGYHNRPELTAERFVPDPLSVGPSRLYRTGDLAKYWSDGTIEFLGRIDHQVKVRGFRIELGEIEVALEAVPGVRQAAVRAIRDDDGSNRLVAFAVLGPVAPSIEALKGHLKARLPEYMLPSSFVVLDSMPLTANGKVDRAALIPPQYAEVAAEKLYVPPDNDAERALAALWEEVLDIHPVGVLDNFYELGGQSLKAAVLVSRIESRLGHRIALESLFSAPTVRELARVIQRRLELSPGAAVALQTRGEKAALFMIAGAGGHVFAFHRFARLLGEDRPTWGMKAYGADGLEPPIDSIPAIATRYAAEMVAAHPTGAFVLAGYSVGASIAYETALRLESMGRTVERVIAIDALAPGWPERVGRLRRWLGHFIRLLTLPKGSRGRYLRHRLKEARKRVLFALNLHHWQAPTIAGLDLVTQATLGAVWGGLTKARGTYRPTEVWNGPIALISSAIPCETFGPNDPLKGWPERTSRPVELHEVHVSHLEMFADHHIDRLAEVFREILDPDRRVGA